MRLSLRFPDHFMRVENGKSANDPEAWRFEDNYRKLNEQAIYTVYPISHIEELLHNVQIMQLMTTLNLTSGIFKSRLKTLTF